MNLLAATATERIGIFVAAAVVIASVVYAIAAARSRDDDAPVGSEIELAPNRKPGLDDDTMEGRRLERALGWSLLLLIVCAIGPLVYWLNEPSRQAGAEAAFAAEALHRGKSLFQPTDAPQLDHFSPPFGCATCHGSVGQGGSTQYTITDFLGRTRQVVWQAPRLDTASLKFSDDELQAILIYGRANTPMPAWGVEGGGPMTEQMILDLVAYMKSLALTPEEAQEVALEEAVREAEALGLPSGLAASSGEALFRANCARCHTKGYAYGEPEEIGGGAFGPNLTNGAVVRQFPDVEDLVEFLKVGSEYAKPYGVRGVGGNEGGGMPGFGQILTDEQIRAIADYVRGL